MLLRTLEKVFGTKHEREVKKMRPLVAAIGDLEERYRRLSDDELRGKTAEFREKIDRGASLDELLIPAFAVCREGARRALGMRHYDVQLIGGTVLHRGKIAEMKTGEGKTLVATLPCYLNGLSGKGVHVVTVNDYLAQRDAEWMGKVHNFLGLSVGVIHGGQSNAAKKRAYRCDITYGQNNEFGFDYLRDNMKFSIYDYAQRDLNFAIVDEVDSILIDEARTPLIISGPGETASDLYVRINELVPKLRMEEHYEVDEKARQVALTEDGMVYAQQILQSGGLLKQSSGSGYREAPSANLYDPINLKVLHTLQQSLRAHALYKREVHYMVTGAGGGEVLIIDEFTGRTLPGRRWSDGLHQAVEAKEHVRIQDENITLATISFQNLFRLYDKLSGMTGTADTEAGEFHSTYKLDVVVIPTNKPIARADHEDVVYKSEREKFNSIVEEIEYANERGQPVLVGTTSVEKSEVLSRILDKKGISANVLNAKQHESEAYVVAQAGRKGAVTVATNMAGRGTDIILGGNAEMLARMDVMRQHAEELRTRREREAEEGTIGSDEEEPLLDIDAAIQEALPRYQERCAQEKSEVLEAGGLVIVGTERHESRRIDNQLRGRSGRQGDPGESRFFLSLEDDLMRIFAGERVQKIMERLGMEDGEPIEHPWVTKAVENAQRKVEERNFDIRKHLLEYDDVMNQQRKSMYALRKQVLMGQYRTVPTDEEKKKGVKPEPVVQTASKALEEAAQPIILDMIRHHAAEPPAVGADGRVLPEDLDAWRKGLEGKEVDELNSLRHEDAARDIYLWFGCQLDLKRFQEDPPKALEFIEKEVAMSLTEQRERLFDMAEDLVVDLVEEHCPAKKHYEDWDLDGLAARYKELFALDATGIEGMADPEEVASRLFQDAERVLEAKVDEFKPEQFLRLFRNVTMQEIDRQWIDHLQGMESLRDGIGLRGYGQRDPKREYKREGYDLFMKMMHGVKASVVATLFRAQRVTEEDLQRQEAQRRQASQKRLEGMQASHADAAADGSEGAEPGRAGQGVAGAAPGINRRQRRRAAARGAAPQATANPKAAAAPAPASQTVKRDKPKLGRNDPCWCGSGKKYKNCHMKADQAAAGSAAR